MPFFLGKQSGSTEFTKIAIYVFSFIVMTTWHAKPGKREEIIKSIFGQNVPSYALFELRPLMTSFSSSVRVRNSRRNMFLFFSFFSQVDLADYVTKVKNDVIRGRNSKGMTR